MRFLTNPPKWNSFCCAEGDAAPPAGGPTLVETPPAVSPQAESLFPAAPPAEASADAIKPPEEPAQPIDKEPDKAPLELKLPEGVEANQEVLDAFQGLAAESGLNQEGAQKLLDLHFKAIESAQTENVKVWNETQTKWETELAADPVLSKPEAKVVLGRAFDEYGTPQARDDFSLTGAGNSPAIARMIHKMAAALSEGGARPPPNPTKAGPKTPAQTLFPES